VHCLPKELVRSLIDPSVWIKLKLTQIQNKAGLTLKPKFNPRKKKKKKKMRKPNPLKN
jgi:hypothetical protein